MKTRAAMVLSVALFLGIALVWTPDTAAGDQAAATQVQTGDDWVFEGCLSYFPSGARCFDVYSFDGDYWGCEQCGETENPSTTTCSRLSTWVLENGYWCL